MGEDNKEAQVVAAEAASQQDTPRSRLETVYREHARSAYLAAYRIIGNHEDAEDVLHTVFARLSQGERALELGETAGAYVRRAAVNAAIDLVRARRRPTTALSEVEYQLEDAAASAPESRYSGRELLGLVRKMIADSEGRGAEIFAMRFFEDLDNQEIANILETSPGSVAVILHRFRHRIIAALAAEIGGTP